MLFIYWCVLQYGELTRDGSALRGSKQSDNISNIASDEHSPPNLSLVIVKTDTISSSISDPMSPESGDYSHFLVYFVMLKSLIFTI